VEETAIAIDFGYPSNEAAIVAALMIDILDDTPDDWVDNLTRLLRHASTCFRYAYVLLVNMEHMMLTFLVSKDDAYISLENEEAVYQTRAEQMIRFLKIIWEMRRATFPAILLSLAENFPPVPDSPLVWIRLHVSVMKPSVENFHQTMLDLKCPFDPRLRVVVAGKRDVEKLACQMPPDEKKTIVSAIESVRPHLLSMEIDYTRGMRFVDGSSLLNVMSINIRRDCPPHLEIPVSEYRHLHHIYAFCRTLPFRSFPPNLRSLRWSINGPGRAATHPPCPTLEHLEIITSSGMQAAIDAKALPELRSVALNECDVEMTCASDTPWVGSLYLQDRARLRLSPGSARPRLEQLKIDISSQDDLHRANELVTGSRQPSGCLQLGHLRRLIVHCKGLMAISLLGGQHLRHLALRGNLSVVVDADSVPQLQTLRGDEGTIVVNGLFRHLYSMATSKMKLSVGSDFRAPLLSSLCYDSTADLSGLLLRSEDFPALRVAKVLYEDRMEYIYPPFFGEGPRSAAASRLPAPAT